MAVTPSNMLPLGSKAPDFTLPNPMTNTLMSLTELQAKDATVIMFICNHCPFVKHIMPGVIECAQAYQTQQIQFIAINSNDANNYPADSPERMKVIAEHDHYPFPYLFDESQEVANAYQAACTPDFYIFDKDLACVYRGRFDGATPGNNEPVTGNDIRTALDNLLTGKPVNPDQKPSMGCNIKWKK